MSTANKIATTALIMATLGYIPSFIALFRTIPRIKVFINSYNKIVLDGAIHKELVFSLFIINKSDIPLKIKKVILLLDKITFEPDSRINNECIIPANDFGTIDIVYYVPNDTIDSELRFLLCAPNKNIKTKRLTAPNSNKTNNRPSNG